MHIGVPAETRPYETRVAATPETVKKYVSQGHRVTVQSGAGTAASYLDDAYAAAGAELVDAPTAFGAEIVLKVQSPTDSELPLLKRGAVLVGMLEPFNVENASKLAAAGITITSINRKSRLIEDEPIGPGRLGQPFKPDGMRRVAGRDGECCRWRQGNITSGRGGNQCLRAPVQWHCQPQMKAFTVRLHVEHRKMVDRHVLARDRIDSLESRKLRDGYHGVNRWDRLATTAGRSWRVE